MKHIAMPLAMLAVLFMFLTPVKVQEITTKGANIIMPVMYPPTNPKPKPKGKNGAKPAPLRISQPIRPKK